jgi:hypothetical protein
MDPQLRGRYRSPAVDGTGYLAAALRTIARTVGGTGGSWAFLTHASAALRAATLARICRVQGGYARPDLPRWARGSAEIRMSGLGTSRPERHRRASKFGPVFDDDVWRYMPLGPVPTLIVAFVGIAAAVYVTVVRSRATRALTVAMLVASVMIVLAYTARGALSNDDGEFSWRLGESIQAELSSINRSLGLINVFGNVAMFVPIGWLVALLVTRRRLLVGTLAGLLLSVLIEVWQMVSGSFGDVDDLELNGFGAFLGAGAATLLRSFGSRAATQRSGADVGEVST